MAWFNNAMHVLVWVYLQEFSFCVTCPLHSPARCCSTVVQFGYFCARCSNIPLCCRIVHTPKHVPLSNPSYCDLKTRCTFRLC